MSADNKDSIKEHLEDGSYGIVQINEELYAFKNFTFNEYYRENGLNNLLEIDIMSRLNHPNIMHLVDIVTPQCYNINGIALILPLGDRMLYDLFDNVILTTEHKLPIIYKIADAIKFLHTNGIFNLDIREENIVLRNGEPLLIGFTNKVKNDIWDFGVVIARFLISSDLFRNNEEISLKTIKELHGIRSKYRDNCIDLLSKMLRMDSQITAEQICKHPLFNSFDKIESSISEEDMNYDYAKDQRDIIKLIIHWASTIYGNESVEILFLGIDLFNRTNAYYKEKTSINRMTCAATSLWIAGKLVKSGISDSKLINVIIKLSEYIKVINLLVPTVTTQDILNMETEIILLLHGALNHNKFYKACFLADELKLTLQHVILAQDSTLYARTDVETWSKLMKESIVTYKYSVKNISINEMIKN